MTRHALHRDNERGSVLIVCLLILSLMGIFSMIAINSTISELKVAGKHKTSMQSFYAAESGIAEVLRRLKGSSSSTDYMGDTSMFFDSNWSAYILTDDSWVASDDPDFDNSLTNYIPSTSSFTDTTVQANSKQNDISYFVRIRHKREYDAEQSGHRLAYPHYLDTDGSTLANTDVARGELIYYGFGDSSQPTKAVQFTTSSATQHLPVEIVTSYGMSGGSLKVIEAEVAKNPGIAVVGAIYSEGNFTGNGNSATISGVDHCGSVLDVPAIYTLDPATASISSATVDGTVDTGTDDLDLSEYVDSLKESTSTLITLTADVNGDTYGAPGGFVTVYSETSGNVGGLRMSNIDGYGTLIVEGDLTLGGGFTWNGLVVVTGTLTFNGGGSGVNIAGAVMSEDTVSLNGGLNIHYDSCTVSESLSSLSYQVVNWRQL